MIIEVTSPGSESRDLEEKRTEYEAAGVEEYWVVDGNAQRVVIHCRSEENFQVTALSEGRLESSVVHGFWIRTEWLWQRPMPQELECLEAMLGRPST